MRPSGSRALKSLARSQRKTRSEVSPNNKNEEKNEEKNKQVYSKEIQKRTQKRTPKRQRYPPPPHPPRYHPSTKEQVTIAPQLSQGNITLRTSHNPLPLLLHSYPVLRRDGEIFSTPLPPSNTPPPPTNNTDTQKNEPKVDFFGNTKK